MLAENRVIVGLVRSTVIEVKLLWHGPPNNHGFVVGRQFNWQGWVTVQAPNETVVFGVSHHQSLLRSQAFFLSNWTLSGIPKQQQDYHSWKVNSGPTACANHCVHLIYPPLPTLQEYSRKLVFLKVSIYHVYRWEPANQIKWTFTPLWHNPRPFMCENLRPVIHWVPTQFEMHS